MNLQTQDVKDIVITMVTFLYNLTIGCSFFERFWSTAKQITYFYPLFINKLLK